MYKSHVQAALLFAALAQVAALSAAQAESRVLLLVAGEAYEGQPAFEVRMGDKVIGSGELAKAIDTVGEGRLFFNPEPDDYIERFEFAIQDGDFSASAPVTVALVNDRFKQEGWGRDRNLFVRSIEVNGAVVRAGALQLREGDAVATVDYQAGLLPVYYQSHKAVAEPPPGGWPKASGRTSRLGTSPEEGATGG